MFKQLALLLVLAVIVQARFPRAPPKSSGGGGDEDGPASYAFQSEAKGDDHQVNRQEQADDSGNIKGSYSFTGADGIQRTVTYEDKGDGVQIQVQTNEPGVISHQPADASYTAKN